MTKGRPPYQALKEAKAIALRQGRLCENTKGRGLLYDFAVHLALLIIYIRVHRLKREALSIEEILVACTSDIIRIRRVPPTPGLVRELWVRSPKGTWRFFIVLDDRVVEIPPEFLPGNGGTRPIRENAPGPDQSAVTAVLPIHRAGFTCPFTVPSPSSE
jgi:hypothetical protein